MVMKFSIPELQNFLYKELGYEKQSVSARNFVSWNRFYSSDDFIYIKPIKDRSPEGMMRILRGDKFRWQIRVAVHHEDQFETQESFLPRFREPRNLIITLWDSGEGVTYNSLMKGYIDKGEPVFMARKINLDENMYSQLTEHSNFFEQYALQPENECPSCGGILVPRKMKKLKQEDPYALARAVSGPNAIPKQRTYLACNNYPVCTHVASYVRI